MLYNVAQLLREPEGSSREYDLDGELRDVDELNLGAVPVSGHVEFIKIDEGILARVNARVVLNTACRRCMDVTSSEYEMEFEEVFIPSFDMETGARVATPDGDSELVIDSRNLLNLSEVIRQFAVIETEVPGLCKPDCKGICAQCGKNLNEGPCDCEQGWIDPRLAVLAQFTDTDDAKSSGERTE